jgi:hypothetical protein
MSEDQPQADNSREVEDVAKLLDIAAGMIDELEGRLSLANAQLEVMQFVKNLTGMRGGAMGPIGTDQSARWTDTLRQRAKAMRRVAGR